jgi:hypothetical protein
MVAETIKEFSSQAVHSGRGQEPHLTQKELGFAIADPPAEAETGLGQAHAPRVTCISPFKSASFGNALDKRERVAGETIGLRAIHSDSGTRRDRDPDGP